MKGVKQQKSSQGPQSGAGLMRFFDVSGGGPQISPLVIIGSAIALIVIVGILSALV